MKIARRKRAQAGTGCFNPGDAKSASRTRLNSFQRAIFGRALVLQAILRDSHANEEPEGRSARPLLHPGLNVLRARIQICALPERELSGLDGEVVDSGLHDRLLSLLKARATFALNNFEQKLIYIYHRWTSVSRLATL